MPKIDIAKIAPRTGSSYPQAFKAATGGREKYALGNAVGLTQFGVNLTRLKPGAASALRHWHENEDEFVFVLEGEVVLRTEAGEQLLTAGMCAGFPAGSEDGHQLINRSGLDAVYLEISNRDRADEGHYSDPDVDLAWSPPHAPGRFTRRDGTPF